MRRQMSRRQTHKNAQRTGVGPVPILCLVTLKTRPFSLSLPFRLFSFSAFQHVSLFSFFASPFSLQPLAFSLSPLVPAGFSVNLPVRVMIETPYSGRLN
jgi:hypothetical protein